MSDSLRPHGLYSPQNSLGQNTGVGRVAFPFSREAFQPRDRIQVSCIAGLDSLPAEPQGSPRILEWVAYPFSRDLPNPGIEPGSHALQADSLPTELSGKPRLLDTC